jgi:hypothetical protein
MKMGEWDIDAAKMSDRRIKELLAAIKTMGEWEAFKREYGWHHSYHVSVLEIEQQNRARAIERGDLYRIVINDLSVPTRYFRTLESASEFFWKNSDASPIYFWNGKMWKDTPPASCT